MEVVFRTVTSYVAISTSSKLESPPLQVEIVTGPGAGVRAAVCAATGANGAVDASNTARPATAKERMAQRIGRPRCAPLGDGYLDQLQLPTFQTGDSSAGRKPRSDAGTT